MITFRPHPVLAAMTALLLLSACAVKQDILAASLDSRTASDGTWVLENAVLVDIRNAAKVRLKADTEWQQLGTIEQGIVYTTRDQVVVVNSFDVYEASIVVSDDSVVGFYLTVQKSFVAATPVAVSLVKGR